VGDNEYTNIMKQVPGLPSTKTALRDKNFIKATEVGFLNKYVDTRMVWIYIHAYRCSL
jgi:hypothetical protein